MSRPRRRGAAETLLALATWILPARRHDWGLAMRAEFLGLEGGRDRTRFALGCVRTALLQAVTRRAVGHLTGTAAAVALVLAGGIASPVVEAEVLSLVLVMASLAWLAGRPGLFGPTGRSRAALLTRACGYVVAGTYLLVTVVDNRGPQILEPGAGVPLGMVTFALYAAVLLAMTARDSAAGPVCLASGAGAGLVAGPACFMLVPFERVLPPLADSLPGHGLWLAAIVVGAPGAAMLTTALRTGSVRQAVVAALYGGAVCAALVSLLGYGAFLLFPDRMPGIVPLNAGSPAVRHALDRLEAGDEYVAGLIWGSLLVAVLGALVRRAVRTRTVVLRAATLCVAALAPLCAAAADTSAAVLAVAAAIVLGMLTLATTWPAGAPAPRLSP
ncbi:hypothetical protein AB0395_17765 [Streptosporangium sp. NPDC051023]|uniref:hypothetical protein n=1 Tax=Streptosporangium sp. NPDC051023 TaxID=3155410 RepID=UPI00344E1673